eukprot:COSAG02_NODE_5015_length_4723_cov_3.671064_8_plen_45_part_00
MGVLAAVEVGLGSFLRQSLEACPPPTHGEMRFNLVQKMVQKPGC